MTTKLAVALFTALVLGTVALTASADAAPRHWDSHYTPNLSDSIQNSSANGF
jgi:hypothetical protein